MQHTHRLVARGEAGLAFDLNGLALGGTDLVRIQTGPQDRRYCEVRSLEELDQILQAAYGRQRDGTATRIHRTLCRISEAIEAGELGRAGIEAVMLGLPELTSDALSRLAEIGDLKKGNTAWQSEPRIPQSQVGGGRWTTDGGSGPAAAVKPARTPARSPIRHKPPQTPRDEPRGSSHPIDFGTNPVDRRDLIPASAVVVAVHPVDAPKPLAAPEIVKPLGLIGLLAVDAVMLRNLTAIVGQKRVNDALRRFDLDPSRPADVVAAAAYAWSMTYLPLAGKDIPANGPGLEAACQAVMRFALLNPNDFLMSDHDPKAGKRVLAAANAGLVDYLVESHARPAGVEPALQTNSARARAAIAEQLKQGRMVAHHLVPAEIWGRNHDIARLAIEGGWHFDAPSNLIGLPYDTDTRERVLFDILPEHRGSHPIYSMQAAALIDYERSISPPDIKPMRARAIMDVVAVKLRDRILKREFHPIIKIWQTDHD